MQIPGFIKGAANRGNKAAQAFVQQYDNGDNTPYDPNAYAAIKAQFDDYNGELSDDFEMEVEEPMSPEEQRANERIDELGEKYKPVDDYKQYKDKIIDDISKATDKNAFEYISDEIDNNLEAGYITEDEADEFYAKLDNKIDESNEKMPLYNSKLAKNKSQDEDLYEELADNEYIYGNLNKDQVAQVLSERKGIDLDKAKEYVDKNFNENFWDEESLSPMEKSLFNYKPDKKLTDEDRELVRKHFEDKDKEKLIEDFGVENESNEERLKEGGMVGRFERAGFDVSDVTDKSLVVNGRYKIVDNGQLGFDVYDGDKKIANDIGNQKNFITLINEYESRNEGGAEGFKKAVSNWYDNLSDESEHAKAYKEDAMKVDPERAALIAKAMEEYVGEKPQRGFITQDQLKRYGEKLGLPQMSDRDLRLMWDDVNNVGGYKSFGTPYDKGGRELEDARSAFAEVVNEEARNRKAKGNYFPYNEDDIYEARNKIADIAKLHEGYDLDSHEAYLSHEEADKIQRIANEYHLTNEDLADISPIFAGELGYTSYGWKSPEQIKGEDFNKAVGSYIKSDGSDQELDKSIKSLKDKGYSDEEIIKQYYQKQGKDIDEKALKETLSKGTYKDFSEGEEVIDNSYGALPVKIVRKLSMQDKLDRASMNNPFAGDYYEVEYDLLGRPQRAVTWAGRLHKKSDFEKNKGK